MPKQFLLFCTPLLLIAVFSCVIPISLKAEKKPAWEFGAGIIAAQTPHYFGSNHYYQGALPYPLLVYRSERLSAQTGDPDEYGQVFLFQNPAFRLEIDVSGRFPVESDSPHAKAPDKSSQADAQIVQTTNYTRRGMPDLPLAGFLGIQLKWKPIPYLLIELPILHGRTIDWEFQPIGSIFSPGIEIRFLGEQKENAVNITTILTHGDQAYNQFYYGVPQPYALSDRPIYKAKSGLTAITYGPTFTWTPQPHLSFIGGYVFHDLTSSVVRDSPLVISHRSRSFGIVLNYLFRQSDQLIEIW